MPTLQKILKPDVSPKRHRFWLALIRSRLCSRLFPTWHFVAVGNAITQQRSSTQRKTFWWNRS